MSLVNLSTLVAIDPSASPYYPVISGNGERIAFETYAANGDFKISTADLTTRTVTEQLDLPNAAYGNGEIDHTFLLTRDGNHLIFDDVPAGTHFAASQYDRAVPTGNQNIYEKDLLTEVITVVSADEAGNPGAAVTTGTHPGVPRGVSFGGFASADGRYVVFGSTATNLVPGQTDGSPQVYVKDTQTGAVRLVSTSAAGVPADLHDTVGEPNADTTKPFDFNDLGSVAISADGNTVAFSLAANELVPGTPSAHPEATHHPQVYLKDLGTGSLSVASSTPSGTLADSYAVWETLSADGNVVLFHTSADNLLPGAADGQRHVYAKTMSTGALTLLAQAPDGTLANAPAEAPVLSPDGRYAVFQSTATNLGSPSGVRQVYVKNLVTGSLTLLSKSDATGDPGDRKSGVTPAPEVFSSDDRRIVFYTHATNLGGVSDNSSVMVADAGPAPADTLGAVATDDVVSPGETTIFTGRSDAIGGTVLVSIDALGRTIGSARVGQDGTWSLTADTASFGPGPHTEIATVQGSSWLSSTAQRSFTIAATSSGGAAAGGGAATAPAPGPAPTSTNPPTNNTPGPTSATPSTTETVSGITGEPYSTVIKTFDPITHDPLALTYLRDDGRVYLHSTALITGEHQSYTYDSGSFFRHKPFASFTDTYDLGGQVLQTHKEDNRDGSQRTEIDADAQRVTAQGSDTFDNNANNTRFVFRPGFGHDVIAGFHVGGPGHDTVQLPSFDRGQLGDILANAREDGPGNTTITIDRNDSITFVGVGLNQLIGHRGDFTFHA